LPQRHLNLAPTPGCVTLPGNISLAAPFQSPFATHI